MPVPIVCPSGIYAITNTVNGKKYIGSAVDVTKRGKRHRYMLANGTHPNAYLLSAWGKYGGDAFTFSVVLVCARADLLMYEQVCIDYFEAFKKGYNLRPVAANNGGVKLTPETRKRIADKNLGRKQSDEEKAKRAKAMTGLKRSAESKARMSAAQTGKKMSDAARQKMSERIYSQEHRDNMSRIKTGLVASPETRAKMSASHKRRNEILKSALN